jgi:hypothetical protein
MSKLGNARRLQILIRVDDGSQMIVTDHEKIPACLYKSCSIEPVCDAHSSRVIVPISPFPFRLISHLFVNVLAHKQYKYTRKTSSTVVNYPCSHLRVVC